MGLNLYLNGLFAKIKGTRHGSSQSISATVPFPECFMPNLDTPSPKFRGIYCSANYEKYEMAIDTKEKLLRFFSANDIELYNNEQVDAWLSCLVAQLKNAKLWHWRPLRSEDIIKCMWGINIWDDICTNGGYSFLDENCRPYSGLVSLEVMEIVIKIIVELGENVKFFVSDYYPFLDYIEGHNRHRKIDTTGMDHFIMVRPSSDYDNWDEEFRLIFGMWNGG